MANEAERTATGGTGEREAIDPVAIALALGRGGDLDPRAAAYLENQARVAVAQERVLQLQAEDLQRENKLHHWSLIVRHISDVLKVAFELAVSTVAIAIVIAIGAAVWMAAHDDGLVIEPFSVPPEMAARGITGETVANAMLDKLTAMQNATDSARPAQSYANNWGNDIKVEIPNTGVSVGQFYHYLASWLGHETHITGEVFRTANGMAVTARVIGGGSNTVTGSEAGFDDLLQQAAESIYGQTQPFRYAVYLVSGPVKRGANTTAILNHLIEDGPPIDRIWSYLGVATFEDFSDPVHAPIENMKAAVLAPDFALPYINLAQENNLLGHEDAALTNARKALELLQKDDGTWMNARARAISLPSGKAALAYIEGDFAASLRFARVAAGLPDYSNIVAGSREFAIMDLARLHETSAMRATWIDMQSRSPRLITKLLADYWIGDWRSVISEQVPIKNWLDGLVKNPPFTKAFEDAALSRQVWPYVATAMAMTGDVKGARALIAKTPLDCDACIRNRGEIEAAAHNWTGANYWFARAAAAAPSIPFADAEWGAALLHKGDYEGAIAKFALANEKGPHFADPLEMWGEALMEKNRSDLALAKFEEANKYAPNWGRLHLKWGEALFYTGKKDEATKQFAAAATLDLSAADRAALARDGAGRR
jgi:tetratricopeptide (TPR) repeat protein